MFVKYIILAILFISCHNNSRKNQAARSGEILDTIKSAPAIISVPGLFESAFIKGTTQKGSSEMINLYGITVGKLKISSGKIVACDPLHIDEYGIPFSQVFPLGEFPVQFSIAELNGEESIAFVRINFSDEPVQRWEFALQKGQSPIPFIGKKSYGYSVDAGMGILVDEDAIEYLDIKKLTDTDAALYQEMKKHTHNGWKYTMYNFGKHNLAAFSTGFGDGTYSTYIGFDAKGKPCRLLTDFGIFDWRKSK